MFESQSIRITVIQMLEFESVLIEMFQDEMVTFGPTQVPNTLGLPILYLSSQAKLDQLLTQVNSKPCQVQPL